MAKAIYYSEILEPKAFDVLKEDKEGGLVDLGVGKTLVVRAAKVVKTPAIGCATLGDVVPDNLDDLAAPFKHPIPQLT